MKSSYFYLAGIASTIIGYIAFKIQQRKDKGKEVERDYSTVDLSRVYLFEPNWKRIKIEWIVILIAGLIAFVYSFSDPTFNSFKSKIMMGIWMIVGLSFIWSVMFLLFNKRKIEINENKILAYSFLSNKPDEINWDELDKAEYVLPEQNDCLT
jgi:magnesium-transporting ATPase (P-type)